MKFLARKCECFLYTSFAERKRQVRNSVRPSEIAARNIFRRDGRLFDTLNDVQYTERRSV